MVPTWEREKPVMGSGKGWLRVTIAAQKLFQHTLKKTSGAMSREYFSKSDTFTKKMPLIKSARKVYHLLKEANLIKDIRTKSDFKQRHKLQIKALIALDDHDTYLETFNDEKPIKNLEEWVRLEVDVEKLLRAWIASDIMRWERIKERKSAQ